MRSVIEQLLPAVTLLLCVATVSIPGWAKSARRQPTAIATEASHRGLHRNAEAGGGAEQWEITVTRADDTMLEGHVTRVGSTSLKGGLLRGTIAGRRITGNVTDAAGALVVSFVGTFTRSGGIRGSYYDQSGAAGRWSWEGPWLK